MIQQPENLTQVDQTANECVAFTDGRDVPMNNRTGESLLFNKLDADEQEDAFDGSPWERAGKGRRLPNVFKRRPAIRSNS